MNCMKCGREIPLAQVFCKECLADMAQFPVKPGTPIQLPPQNAVTPPRRPSHPRKVKKPEEQLARLRKLVKFQTFALIFVVLLLILYGLYHMWYLPHKEQPLSPGQNYSTIEPTDPDRPLLP